MHKIITVRPLTSEDASFAFMWTGDHTVTKPLFWDHHPSEQDTAEFLKAVAESHPWFMAICEDGTPVGAITLDKGKGRSECRAELGYVLRKSAWGRGIATEATKIAIARGFDDLNIERIEAFVDPENLASVRVLEKSGMNREAYLNRYLIHRGKVRDRLIFAATRRSP